MAGVIAGYIIQHRIIWIFKSHWLSAAIAIDYYLITIAALFRYCSWLLAMKFHSVSLHHRLYRHSGIESEGKARQSIYLNIMTAFFIISVLLLFIQVLFFSLPPKTKTEHFIYESKGKWTIIERVREIFHLFDLW